MEDKREILDYLRLGERVLKGTLEELGRDWRTEEFVIKDIAIV